MYRKADTCMRWTELRGSYAVGGEAMRWVRLQMLVNDVECFIIRHDFRRLNVGLI